MNIDEFLDSVSAENLSKTPVVSTSKGVNALPPQELVRNVMDSKFDTLPKLTIPPSLTATTQSLSQKSKSAQLAQQQLQQQTQQETAGQQSVKTAIASAQMTATLNTSLDAPLANAAEQFESLSIALETSLASADYQHAFDTYIALQSALAHLHEQQKKQQRLFQERLNQFKTKLFNAVQASTAQFQSVMQELYVQIGQIKQLVDNNQIDAASNQYASVKQTIDQLPNNFADKKEKLQDELLKVYLYLKARSETHTATSFTGIATEMKRLYVLAVAAIKTGNYAQAQQLYEQLAANYAQLPEGFTDQKVQLFDYVTFLHSQLTLEPQSQLVQQQVHSQTQSQLQSQLHSQVQSTPRVPLATAESDADTSSVKVAKTLSQAVAQAAAPVSTTTVPSNATKPVTATPPMFATSSATNANTLNSPRIPAAMRTPLVVETKAPQQKAVTQTKESIKLEPVTREQLDKAKADAQLYKSQVTQVTQVRPVTPVTPATLATSTLPPSAPSQQPLLQPLSKSKLTQKTAEQRDEKLTEKPQQKAAEKPALVIEKVEKTDAQFAAHESAQHLQERAKKLAARLEELKKSLDN